MCVVLICLPPHTGHFVGSCVGKRQKKPPTVFVARGEYCTRTNTTLSVADSALASCLCRMLVWQGGAGGSRCWRGMYRRCVQRILIVTAWDVRSAMHTLETALQSRKAAPICPEGLSMQHAPHSRSFFVIFTKRAAPSGLGVEMPVVTHQHPQDRWAEGYQPFSGVREALPTSSPGFSFLSGDFFSGDNGRFLKNRAEF